MTATSYAPRTRRTAQNTQYVYDLNRRVYAVKPYPILSPQGANILLYGHENGVTVIWRGGKRLKSSVTTKKPQKQNGASSDDAVMVIDSDDEAPQTTGTPSVVQQPEFEEATLDDPSTIPEITQTLDLSFGTAVLHIAVLPLVPSAPVDLAWQGQVLEERMVFAVSCATSDVFVVTLPLTPPSKESKMRQSLQKDLLARSAGTGTWGETLTTLGGQSTPSDGLAINVIRQATVERSVSSEKSEKKAQQATRVVVAAHSREAGGSLRLWDVSLDAKADKISRVEPFQTEYLPAPLTGVAFNPTHSTQLLTIASPLAVRVYDYNMPSLPQDDAFDGPFPSQGSWLLSLYAPFAKASLTSTARKPVLDAAWVSNGRAVLALLADGQWGIWDIEGAAPTSNGSGGGPSLFGKATSGLRGAALATFSVSGYLEGTSPLRNPGSQKSSMAPGSGGEFAPMTPHARRDALAASMAGGTERLAAIRGGVDVTPLPIAAGLGNAESAVLWIGGPDPIVTVVSNISRFWDAQAKRSSGGGVNLFSGAQPTRMIRLTDLGAGLQGERCTGVTAAARFLKIKRQDTETLSGTPRAEGSKPVEGLAVEVLVRGESRLVVVRESDEEPTFTNRLTGNLKKVRPRDRQASAIIAYPRPEKPNSVRFNLSVRKSRGPNSRADKDDHGNMPLRPDIFPSILANPDLPIPSKEDVPGTKGKRGSLAGLFGQDNGFAFAGALNVAADAVDDEELAEDRNVEEEMLDIMEIDAELEELESDRLSGQKHVFFEDG